jgi:hypothetical protein
MTGLEHETDEGGAHDASLSANNFNCAICFELLLDPVVGKWHVEAYGGLALVQQLFSRTLSRPPNQCLTAPSVSVNAYGMDLWLARRPRWLAE